MAVVIEFGSRGDASSPSGIATVTGLDFNAEASDRYIVVTISCENDTTTAVTIAGIDADPLKADGFSTSARMSVWGAAVPTGASGDVVANVGGAISKQVSIDTYSVTGANTDALYDSDSANGTDVDISITSLTIPSGGGGICGYCNATSTTAVAWTGAAESHDTQVSGTLAHRHSSAIVTVEGTNTITADAATAGQALVGIAFEPASGGAAIEGAAAQTLGAFTQAAASVLPIDGAASQTLAAVSQASASKLKIKGVA